MSPTPYLFLLVFAVAVRAFAATLIGPEPFGPDAPGVDAAVVLGGHPYPVHPALVKLLGGMRPTSVLLGAMAVLGCARLSERLDGSPWSGGLLAACAPLFVFTGAMDGGDAPALGLCALGLAFAYSDKPLVGGLLCALSLAVKPIVAPALVPVLLAPLFSKSPARHMAMLATGLCLGIAPFHEVLDPLVSPKPRAGVLGSWFLATGGEFPSLGELPALMATSIQVHIDLPTWIGHPLLGALAGIGALLPGPRRRERIALFALAGFTMLLTTALLGEATRPRWLAAASFALVALGGVALRRVPYLALAFLWPALAAVDQLATLRSLEDPGTASGIGIGWPGRIDTIGQFRDSSICHASELRALVDELEGHQGTLHVLQLRDGREGELVWPLQARRPDLDIRVVSSADDRPVVLPGAAVEDCVTEVSHNPARLDEDVAYGVQGAVVSAVGSVVKPVEVRCPIDVDWEGHVPIEQSLGKGEFVTIPGAVFDGELLLTVRGSRSDGYLRAPGGNIPYDVRVVDGEWVCDFR